MVKSVSPWHLVEADRSSLVAGHPGQGLTLVHFSAQLEPFLSRTDGRYLTYPTKKCLH